MVHRMNLYPGPFNEIETGRKIFELRLYDSKRRTLNIGDYIIFSKSTDPSCKLATSIKALYRFSSFKELFAVIAPISFGIEKEVSVEEASMLMNRFYTDEQIKQYGVLAIRIELADMEEVERKEREEETVIFERFFPDGLK